MPSNCGGTWAALRGTSSPPLHREPTVMPSDYEVLGWRTTRCLIRSLPLAATVNPPPTELLRRWLSCQSSRG